MTMKLFLIILILLVAAWITGLASGWYLSATMNPYPSCYEQDHTGRHQ